MGNFTDVIMNLSNMIEAFLDGDYLGVIITQVKMPNSLRACDLVSNYPSANFKLY